MSFFEINKIKEQNTLELENGELTTNIKFNYYPIQCNDIQRNPPTAAGEIRANYRGNRPAVIYSNSQYFPTFYQTSELSITSKTHPGNHNAELIVKHVPFSSSIMNLYVYFPLIQMSGDDNATNHTMLDNFIETATKSHTPDFFDGLDLTEYVNDKKWSSYESTDKTGNKCIVVVVEPAINIYADLSIFKEPVATSTTPPPALPIKEGFKQTNDGGLEFTDDQNNEMICEIIPGNEDGEMIDMYQVPIGGAAYLNRQNMNNTITVVYLIIFMAVFFFNLAVFPSFYLFLLNSMNDDSQLKKEVSPFLGIKFGTGLWVLISAIYLFIIFILFVIGLSFSSTIYIMFAVLLLMSYFVAAYGIRIRQIIIGNGT